MTAMDGAEGTSAGAAPMGNSGSPNSDPLFTGDAADEGSPQPAAIDEATRDPACNAGGSSCASDSPPLACVFGLEPESGTCRLPRSVDAGGYHTCVVLPEGNVRCWGFNGDGRLGYGQTESIGDDETPAAAGDVDVGGPVLQIATGSTHTCALLEGGNVRCWGRNSDGQLGYANTEHIGDDEAPAAAGDVDIGGRAIQLATGGSHTCALLETGNVRCWGRGVEGQLGYANTEPIGDDEIPAAAGDVAVGAAVGQISAGFGHTCALLVSGEVRCWGDSTFGELGYSSDEAIGDDEFPASIPAPEVGVSPSTQISAGGAHTCVLGSSGDAECWGDDSTGQLSGVPLPGAVYSIYESLPFQRVALGGGILQIAAGDSHTCVLRSDHGVHCRGLLVQVPLTPEDDPNSFFTEDLHLGAAVVRLTTGGQHTCALLEDGNLRCFGNGDAGQLGYGTTESIGDDESPASAGNVPFH
jgi:alpha-tubulin suppressor-like RCC1 family protein